MHGLRSEIKNSVKPVLLRTLFWLRPLSKRISRGAVTPDYQGMRLVGFDFGDAPHGEGQKHNSGDEAGVVSGRARLEQMI